MLELLAKGVYFIYPENSLEKMQKKHSIKLRKLERDLAEAKNRAEEASKMY